MTRLIARARAPGSDRRMLLGPWRCAGCCPISHTHFFGTHPVHPPISFSLENAAAAFFLRPAPARTLAGLILRAAVLRFRRCARKILLSSSEEPKQ